MPNSIRMCNDDIRLRIEDMAPPGSEEPLMVSVHGEANGRHASFTGPLVTVRTFPEQLDHEVSKLLDQVEVPKRSRWREYARLELRRRLTMDP